ncbi:hypothetical protein TrVFT333_006016 [Trichoderma virens FT-333]|nr:hypothetical protein TrVFT333_006016 [Trichoderma virens FT-333]
MPPPISTPSACSNGNDGNPALASLVKSADMFKVNYNNPADEEVVPIYITMNQQQAVQSAKMDLAFGQVVDAGRLSINFLQQETHDFPAICQMAEELGRVGMHIWMMTRHFEAPPAKMRCSLQAQQIDAQLMPICLHLGQHVRKEMVDVGKSSRAREMAHGELTRSGCLGTGDANDRQYCK